MGNTTGGTATPSSEAAASGAWTIVIKGVEDGGHAGHIVFNTVKVSLAKGAATTVAELVSLIEAQSLPTYDLKPFTPRVVGPMFPATKEEKSYPPCRCQHFNRMERNKTVEEIGLVNGCCLYYSKPLPPGVHD